MADFDALKEASRCIRDDLPACSAMCPFRFDIRTFMPNLQKGNMKKAYNEYHKAVLLTGIVSRICSAPCEKACFRQSVDGSVNIKALEQAVALKRDKNAQRRHIPPKKKKVLVIGAGLAGIGVSVRLADRGYEVILVEERSIPGGSLWEEYPWLDREECLNELNQILDHRYISVQYGTKVLSLNDFEYDAAVNATGASDRIDMHRDGCFTVGRAADTSLSLTEALAEGMKNVPLIDAYLRGTSYLAPAELQNRYRPETEKWDIKPAALRPGDDPDESAVIEEASRCRLCTCDLCVQECEILRHYYTDPVKALNDINATIHKTEFNTKKAQPFINNCTLCGKCGARCPQGIDFAEASLYTRQRLRDKNSMPPVYHEFWINESMHASGSDAAIIKIIPGYDKASWAFFPGCQLGGSDPEYVSKSFSLLKDVLGDDGAMFLRCCSVPMHWAGQETDFLEEIERIREEHRSLGSPEIIVACPSCLEVFIEYMPDLPVRTLYDVLKDSASNGSLIAERAGQAQMALFDPCVSARVPELRHDVRTFLGSCGIHAEDLIPDDEASGCCGYGGLIYLTNQDVFREAASTAAYMSDKDYITYCINCRDSFSMQGKRAVHILDLMMFPGQDRSLRRPPTPTQRRHNRIHLKASLLEEFWGICQPLEEEKADNSVSFTDEASDQAASLLLIEDVIAGIVRQSFNEKRVIKKDDLAYTCYRKAGSQTIHADFRTQEDGSLMITDVYAHRITYIERQDNDTDGSHPDLYCCKCNRNLEDSTANFEYLGREFHHTLPVCPSCRMIYLSKDICETRLREVELMLEEK